MTRQMRMSAVQPGDVQKGSVKFFNAEKGYGFIGPNDGGPDVFVHVSAVEGPETAALDKQDLVEFELGQPQDGRRNFALRVRLLQRARRPSTGKSTGRSFRSGSGLEAAGRGSGVVKWFDVSKGFGFITPKDGDKDVFIHARVLKRAGLTDLISGEAVSFDLQVDRRSGRLSVSKIMRLAPL
ncbi:cold-shock protein [Pseudaminobacter sp. NGMCC 1.201702]